MAWVDVVNNFASNLAGITNSYISNGGALLSGTPTNYTLNSNPEALFTFLKDYKFVVGIRDLIVSTLKEALADTDFAVSSKDESKKKLLDKYNNTLRDMNFKSKLMEDLDDIVWRGQYLYGIDNSGKRIFELKDPTDIKFVRKRNYVAGYLYHGKFIDQKDAVGYYYKVDNKEVYSNTKAKKKNIKLDEALENFEVGVTVFNGKSVFKPLLDNLYQIFVQEYILYQLGLRESIRPEIISMIISGNRTNIVQATNAADNIERLLNQSSASLTSAIDPINFLNQITYYLLNNIKVVPQIDNFSSLSDINVDSLVDKRQQLANECEENKKQFLSAVGVPDELFSGNSNKWEVMSRNDRYATLSNAHLSSISGTVKRLIISLASRDGVKFTEDELIFNLEVSSFLSSYESKSKLTTLNDKLRELDGLVGTINSLKDNELLNKDKFTEYINKSLGMLDADLVSLIDLNNRKSDSNESNETEKPSTPRSSHNSPINKIKV